MLTLDDLDARMCPKCGCDRSKVIDIRDTTGMVKRRRKCPECGYRWSTVEVEKSAFDELITTSVIGGKTNVRSQDF